MRPRDCGRHPRPQGLDVAREPCVKRLACAAYWVWLVCVAWPARAAWHGCAAWPACAAWHGCAAWLPYLGRFGWFVCGVRLALRARLASLGSHHSHALG